MSLKNCIFQTVNGKLHYSPENEILTAFGFLVLLFKRTKSLDTGHIALYNFTQDPKSKLTLIMSPSFSISMLTVII